MDFFLQNSQGVFEIKFDIYAVFKNSYEIAKLKFEIYQFIISIAYLFVYKYLNVSNPRIFIFWDLSNHQIPEWQTQLLNPCFLVQHKPITFSATKLPCHIPFNMKAMQRRKTILDGIKWFLPQFYLQ